MSMRAGLEAGQRVDSYEVVRLIGEGATGSVYEAKHAFLGRRVALKCLHTHHVARADVRERMRREAVVLSQIRHSNVVTVWDAGMLDSGLVWIAMDLLEGQTLRAKLAGDRPLAISQALYVAAECADGVEAAHEVDVVHRDLKPENIFITDKNEVKVLDLGTAKFLGYGFQTTELNKVPGTLAYMSPEHLSGEIVSPRSDIYALGLILYEMLAGHHVFARGSNANMPNRYELGALHQFGHPRPLTEFVPGVSAELWTIVELAIKKKAEERIPTMREFAVLLREERSRNVIARKDSPVHPLERRGGAGREATGAVVRGATGPAPNVIDRTLQDTHLPPATTRREGTRPGVPRSPGVEPAVPPTRNVPPGTEERGDRARLSPIPPRPLVRAPRPERVDPPESEPATVDEKLLPGRRASASLSPGTSAAPAAGFSGPGLRSLRGPGAPGAWAPGGRPSEPTPPPVSRENALHPETFLERLARRSPAFLVLVGLALASPVVVGMAFASRALKHGAAAEVSAGAEAVVPAAAAQPPAPETVLSSLPPPQAHDPAALAAEDPPPAPEPRTLEEPSTERAQPDPKSRPRRARRAPQPKQPEPTKPADEVREEPRADAEVPRASDSKKPDSKKTELPVSGL